MLLLLRNASVDSLSFWRVSFWTMKESNPIYTSQSTSKTTTQMFFCKDRLKSWLIVWNIWFRLISEWRIKPHCFNPIIWKESNADQKWPIWSIMKRKISFLLLTLSRTVFNLQNSKNILNNLIIFWNEPTLFYCLIDKAKITAQRILRLLH